MTCPSSTAGGVVCNSAGGNGGGFYASGGSLINLIGTDAHPARVAKNDAATGGGIFLTGSTTQAIGTDSWITGNRADTIGGGVYARSSAYFEESNDIAHCSRGASCSLFEGDLALMTGSAGGAIALDTGADAKVYQTTFTNNSADTLGSVAYLDGTGTTMLCEGCVAYADSGSLNDAFFETDHSAALTVGYSTLDEDTGCCKGIFDTNNSSSVRVYSSILLASYGGTGQGKIFDDAIGTGEVRVGDCLLYRESRLEPARSIPGQQLRGHHRPDDRLRRHRPRRLSAAHRLSSDRLLRHHQLRTGEARSRAREPRLERPHDHRLPLRPLRPRRRRMEAPVRRRLRDRRHNGLERPGTGGLTGMVPDRDGAGHWHHGDRDGAGHWHHGIRRGPCGDGAGPGWCRDQDGAGHWHHGIRRGP